MTVADALDGIEFVSRLPARVRMLDVLRNADGLSRTELGDRLDASRTTVGRNVEALCEQGIVANDEGEYAPTRAGEPIVADLLYPAGAIGAVQE